MPAGRPTELTPAVAEIICDCVKRGNYREVAARLAGVSPDTVGRWMKRGLREPESVYGGFRRAVLRAEQDAEIEMVDVVRGAARTDAKHAEWWLERKCETRWARDRRRIAALEKQLAELTALLHAQPPHQTGADADAAPDVVVGGP